MTGSLAAAISAATCQPSSQPVRITSTRSVFAIRNTDWMSAARCTSTTSGSLRSTTGISASRSSRLAATLRIWLRSKSFFRRAYCRTSSNSSRMRSIRPPRAP
jgi:hypothetical protein